MTEAVGDFQFAEVPPRAAAERPVTRLAPSKRVRIPMQLAVALSVILLLGIVIAGLSWQAYRSSQRALINSVLFCLRSAPS